MRKLLLLLPALALASCSGGHDLMSNKPFRMTCAEDGKKTGDVMLVSPDLPQATVLFPGSGTEVTYELVVKTPVRFELRRGPRSGIQNVISINRETGQISYGVMDETVGWREVNPAPESTKCTFETL